MEAFTGGTHTAESLIHHHATNAPPNSYFMALNMFISTQRTKVALGNNSSQIHLPHAGARKFALQRNFCPGTLAILHPRRGTPIDHLGLLSFRFFL